MRRKRNRWAARRWWAGKRGRTMARAHWRAKHAWMRTRAVDPDTLRWRAQHDARGQLLREGTNYSATGVHHWQIRRSVRGRVKQVDFVIDGTVWRTGALRLAERALRTGRWLLRRKPVALLKAA